MEPITKERETMAIAEHTTHDGYTLTVFSSMYLDWGLTITRPDGTELMSNPHCLSSEVYGASPPSDMTWDEAIDAGVEFKPWTEKEWTECLASEADELIEAYGGYE